MSATITMADEPVEAEQPVCCLYFLVCAATTGPRAGLFKLGITDDLVTRHGQHVKNWDEFDLRRSVRLRGASRREILALETTLKHRFRKWRRYPGGKGSGHSEFFATECLPDMLALVRIMGVAGLGGELSDKLDPAECLPSPKAKVLSAADRQRRGELVKERNAHKRQEKAEWGEHITRELDWVVYIVQDYQTHLLWVDLTHWYELLAKGESARCTHKGMIDLYFGGFRSEFADAELEKTGERRRTVAAFTSWVGTLQRSAVRTHTPMYAKHQPEAMFHLRAPLVEPGDRLPHPICADAILLRVQCARFIPHQPFLSEFEAMVRRIESRRHLEQLDFSL